MKPKTIYTLLAILVALVGVTFLLEGPLKKEYKDKIKEISLVEFKKEDVHKIEISKKDEKKVVLVKKDEVWQISSYQDYPAEEEKINRLLEKIEKIEGDEIVSRNPEKQKIFEVDKEKGTLLELLDVKDKVLASFYVGKSGPDYSSTYLRQKDANEVFLVKEYITSSDLSTESKDWLEKKIFKFKLEEVVKLSLKTKEEEISAIKDKDEEWEIISPSKLPGKKSALESIARSLSNLRINDYVKEKKEEDCGLIDTSPFVEVELKEGEKERLLIGKLEESKYFVKKGGGNYIYQASKYTIENMQKKLEDLIEKKLFSFSRDEVEEVKINSGKEEIQIKKEKEEWVMTKPPKYRVKEDALDELLTALRDLKAKKVYPAGKFKEISSGGTKFEISFTLKDKAERKLILGKKEKEGILAKKGNKEYIYLIAEGEVKTLKKELKDLQGEKVE